MAGRHLVRITGRAIALPTCTIPVRARTWSQIRTFVEGSSDVSGQPIIEAAFDAATDPTASAKQSDAIPSPEGPGVTQTNQGTYTSNADSVPSTAVLFNILQNQQIQFTKLENSLTKLDARMTILNDQMVQLRISQAEMSRSFSYLSHLLTSPVTIIVGASVWGITTEKLKSSQVQVPPVPKEDSAKNTAGVW